MDRVYWEDRSLMWEFLSKIFKKMDQKNSKDEAKNRLRLVLVHDRAAMPTGLMDQLRADLIEVISKYVEIDADNINLDFDTAEDNSVAVVANIPIKEIKRK